MNLFNFALVQTYGKGQNETRPNVEHSGWFATAEEARTAALARKDKLGWKANLLIISEYTERCSWIQDWKEKI